MTKKIETPSWEERFDADIAPLLEQEYSNTRSEVKHFISQVEKDAYERGLNESKVGETKRVWYQKGYDDAVKRTREEILELIPSDDEDCVRLGVLRSAITNLMKKQ